MHVYLINLECAKARLAAFDAEASRIGLFYERIRAVEASSIGDTPIGMSPTAVACFHSHRLAWQRIAESGDEWGTIFEDDVLLSNAIPNLFQNLRWIPSDVSLIKLETVYRPIKMRRRGIFVTKIFKLHELLSYHCGSAGYIIRSDDARRLLLLSETIDRPVDDVLFDLIVAKEHGLRVLQMVPAICVQDMVLAEREGRAILHQTQMEADSRSPIRLLRTPRERLLREVMRLARRLRNLKAAT